jgi:hypothetical protein
MPAMSTSLRFAALTATVTAALSVAASSGLPLSHRRHVHGSRSYQTGASRRQDRPVSALDRPACLGNGVPAGWRRISPRLETRRPSRQPSSRDL